MGVSYPTELFACLVELQYITLFYEQAIIMHELVLYWKFSIKPFPSTLIWGAWWMTGMGMQTPGSI